MTGQAPDNALFAVEAGRGSDVPLVFLHGFGGAGRVWSDMQEVFASEAGSLAYDLPGHGGSLDADGLGGAGRMAKAIAADLAARGIRRAHLVGHSMGGAVATMLGLRNPKLAASMTLLAPGGFGHEINHRLLKRFALARTSGEMELVLENMFGWNKPIPALMVDSLVQARNVPGAQDRLLVILESILREKGGEFTQGLIMRDDFSRLSMPVKVLWGTQDRVLPTRQSHRLPSIFAAHVFENTGHMLIEECTDEVIVLIRQNMRAGTL